jgi:NAD(P)-dependent dehydrogenase (short-subunit alcohol dehydrogenase family)
MFSLKGKVAVVTGAASGIGASIAQRFRAADAKVLVADITDASALARSWGCSYRKTDVSEPSQVAAMLDQAMEEFGALDVLVNNAAIANVHPVQEADIDRADRYYRVNALSVLAGIREASKRMKRGASIISMSSLSGVRGTPGWGEYAMSKAAVVAITQTAAIELAPLGIRVNCICPGGVETPASIAVNGDKLDKAMSALAPLGRIGKPEDIAAMAHFLASDDAGYVTGQAYLVDGGWSVGTTIRTFELALA